MLQESKQPRRKRGNINAIMNKDTIMKDTRDYSYPLDFREYKTLIYNLEKVKNEYAHLLRDCESLRIKLHEMGDRDARK